MTTSKDGADRIRDESSTYFARYRDGNNHVVEVATGCRDESAARQVLADLERKAERVRAGLLSPAEARTTEHLTKPIAEHIEAFLGSLEAKGEPWSCPGKPSATFQHSPGLCVPHAGRARPWDVRAVLEPATTSGSVGTDSQRGPGNHRHVLQLVAVEMGRLTANPFKSVPKADQKADRRRQRRAMTAEELVRLLDVARRRPLLDAMTVRRGKRKGQAVANVSPENRERFEAVGREQPSSTRPWS